MQPFCLGAEGGLHEITRFGGNGFNVSAKWLFNKVAWGRAVRSLSSLEQKVRMSWTETTYCWKAIILLHTLYITWLIYWQNASVVSHRITFQHLDSRSDTPPNPRNHNMAQAVKHKRFLSGLVHIIHSVLLITDQTKSLHTEYATVRETHPTKISVIKFASLRMKLVSLT